MDIIKIGDDALKISLCNKEVEKYELTKSEKLSDLKKSFIKLLLEAKDSVSFKILGKKIIAEMFSGKDGSCEIFISRVEVGEALYKEKIPQEITKKQRLLTSIFSFDDIDKLLVAAKRLHSIGYRGDSSLYYDEIKHQYYIFLEDVSVKELKYAFLCEFAVYIRYGLCAFIKEHFKCVMKRDAIKILSKI